jgi:hypothetical protein
MLREAHKDRLASSGKRRREISADLAPDRQEYDADSSSDSDTQMKLPSCRCRAWQKPFIHCLCGLFSLGKL